MVNILKLVRGDASKHAPREVKSAIRLPAGRCGEPQMSMHVRHAIKATIIQPCCRERNQAAEITVWSGSRCNPELEDTKVPLREVVSFVRATPLLSIVSGATLLRRQYQRLVILARLFIYRSEHQCLTPTAHAANLTVHLQTTSTLLS